MEELKQELRNLVAKNRIKQVLQQLNGLPENQKGGRDMDIITVQSQFAEHNRNATIGILDPMTASREKTMIVQAILSIIDDLGEAVPAPQPVPVSEPAQPQTGNGATNVSKKKILFLASNPTNTGQLRLGEEHREVGQSLREARVRDQFELSERFAVTAKSLFTALLDENPQIVHFSGHGEMVRDQAAASGSEQGYRSLIFSLGLEEEAKEGYSGGIIVEDNQGKARMVNADTLASLFGNISGIECVILNACYSEVQAKAILEAVPYVIGMNTAVPDRTAIVFAAGFYRALGDGREIENAFNLAKNLVSLEGLPGADIPVLKVNQALLG